MWNGILVDGHNRYKICTEHSLAFRTAQKEFEDRDEAKLWIMKNQLSRRNLNDFQRIEIIRKCEDAVKAQAKKRQAEYYGNQYESGHQEKLPEVLNTGKRATEELGEMAGVSRKTYEHAVEVLDNAPEEVVQAVRKGDISINKAYTEGKG